MNNSFERLVDGMCATLRSEVLSRLDDEFARGQVFGVINLLNTFKARADWSAGFLLQQIHAQQTALNSAADLLAGHVGPGCPPAVPHDSAPAATPIDDLLALREDGNRSISRWLAWLDAERDRLPPETVQQTEKLLRAAMRAEIEIELKNSPRPLFAEMSSGQEA